MLSMDCKNDFETVILRWKNFMALLQIPGSVSVSIDHQLFSNTYSQTS